MTKYTILKASVAPAVLGLALIAAPASAQVDNTTESAIQSDEASDAGVIVVTGSRIARREVESAAPVAVVQDEEFKLSGTVNVENVLNTLPQVIPGTTSFSNNPGGGVATLNLRGLGSNRTMVLVNGRRYMFFDTTQVTDLNTIPSFLIDSVDVVTGGASAVYGSDALAGVVNFRLRNDLEGVEVGGQYSLTGEGDGARYNAYAALGGSFDDGRGHATVFAEYYRRKPIFAGGRDFSRSAMGGELNGLPFGPAGSSTGPEGRFNFPGTIIVQPAFEDDDAVEAILAEGTVFDDAFFAQPGVSRPRTGADLYNYAPANYLQVAQERYLMGGYADYNISDSLTAYAEVTFVNNRVPNELAATPVTGNFNINIDAVSPFLSAADIAELQQIDANETAINAQRLAYDASVGNCADPDRPDTDPPCLGPLYSGAASAALQPGVVNGFIQRRITETGSRNTMDERNAFRTLIGLKGDITDRIGFDAYYSYARTRNSNIQLGNISRSAFQAGLDGSAPAINIFGPGTLTPTMVDQISILAQNGEASVLQVASGVISGSAFNFGMGADDVGFAVGVEYRKVSSEFIPDTALSSGDVIGFNAGNPTAGSYNVKEIFGELNVPILGPDSGIEKLNLNAAARYSDYSLDAVGGVFTYAGGIEFAPIRDITFRGQYQRAIRAPNVSELFAGQSQGFPGASDPCANPAAATDPTISALCVATGVPAGLVGDSALQLNSQIQGTFGGNPDLQEEKSDSYTAGVIVQPSFFPGLTITADYYNITVEDSISTLGGGLNNTLNLCYNVIQDINSVYCQPFVGARNSGGVLDGVNPPSILNANIGKLETSGVDVQVAYSTPIGMSLTGAGESRLAFNFLGTWTDSFKITPVADLPDQFNECAGRFGQLACGNPTPEYKFTTRLSWQDGPLTTSVRWRHLSSVRDDDDDFDYAFEKIAAYNLIDLSLTTDVNENLTLGMGINNLFDKKPQVIGDNQEQSNTYPGTYDVLGRDFFVSASMKF